MAKLLTDLQKATMLGNPLGHGIKWVGSQVKQLTMSWTKLEKFEQCPRAYNAQFVLGTIPFDAKNKHLVWGNKVHEDLEKFMLGGVPFPVETVRFLPKAQKIKDNVNRLNEQGKLRTPMNGEQQWAMTADGKQASWFDNENVFFRNKADLIWGTNKTLYGLDWKTGKGAYPKLDQLQVAGLVIKAQPRLAHYEKHKQALVFLEADKLVPIDVDLSPVGHENLMRDYLSRSIKVVEAYEEQEWGMNPSPLCAFCGDTTCPYNKSV